jgi:hypothetical protein
VELRPISRRLRRRLHRRLVDPLLVWLAPALLVIVAAHALAHSG